METAREFGPYFTTHLFCGKPDPFFFIKNTVLLNEGRSSKLIWGYLSELKCLMQKGRRSH